MYNQLLPEWNLIEQGYYDVPGGRSNIEVLHELNGLRRSPGVRIGDSSRRSERSLLRP
jgi:hypothetical protein